MEGYRRTFGIAEPIRRGMELKIAREGEWRPAVLGGVGRGEFFYFIQFGLGRNGVGERIEGYLG